MKASALIITILFAFALGCAHKETVKPADTSKAASATAAQASATGAANAAAAANNASSKSGASADQQAAAALQGKLHDIHFDYNKSVIQNSDKPVLKDLAATLKAKKALGVRVEGNCDERGTTEYNLALGDRRARAAKDFLVAQGVRAKRIKAASNGKEKPLCAEHNEECWAKNRRDAFVLAEHK